MDQATRTSDDILPDVIEVITNALNAGHRSNSIDADTRLDSLGLDSMNVMDVFLGLEERFDVTFEDDEIDLTSIETMGDFAEFMDRVLRSRQA